MLNTYSTWWSRKWNGEHPTQDLPEQAAPDSAHLLPERRDLWRALGQLRRRQRAVIVLRFYRDQTEAQTANLLGCSVGTIKSQTSKRWPSSASTPPSLRTGRACDEPH